MTRSGLNMGVCCRGPQNHMLATLQRGVANKGQMFDYAVQSIALGGEEFVLPGVARALLS